MRKRLESSFIAIVIKWLNMFLGVKRNYFYPPLSIPCIPTMASCEKGFEFQVYLVKYQAINITLNYGSVLS